MMMMLFASLSLLPPPTPSESRKEKRLKHVVCCGWVVVGISNAYIVFSSKKKGLATIFFYRQNPCSDRDLCLFDPTHAGYLK